MATSTTILNMNQLTDAALFGHELGTVNFRLLHTVLQIIIHQAGFEDVMVEFKDAESQQLQKLMDPKAKGGFKATQYNITSESKKIKKNERGSVVIVPTNGDEVTPAFTVAVTTESFSKLVEDVENLKTKYEELTHLSTNAELMKAVQNNEGAGPIVDMFQISNLQKRIEAAEEGMSKMASIVEDVARVSIITGGDETSTGADAKEVIEKATKLRTSIDSGRGSLTSSLPEQVKELEKKVRDLEIKFGELSPGSIPNAQGSPQPEALSGPVDIGEELSKNDLSDMKTEEALKLIQKELINIKTLIKNVDLPNLQKKLQELRMNSGGTGEIRGTSVGGTGEIRGTSVGGTGEIRGTSVGGAREIGGARESVVTGVADGGTPSSARSSIKPAAGGDITEKMARIEVHFTECINHVKSLDAMFKEKMNIMSNHVALMEKEIGSLTEKIMLGNKNDQATASGPDYVKELYRRFAELENITSKISETTEALMDERADREAHITALREQLDLLNTLKVDKSEIETLLAEKVDVGVINRKVSHEQFDATCTDLTKGIEEALIKLTKQEELWQQALTDIQTEVGSKLDKMELGPLRDFITNKLSVLQGKLKALAKYKREQEAAGTKAALLKDVKCISCDQDVVMRKNMDPSLFPRPPALPPTKTMAPYLAYELDQLRKQQKTLSSSRNMHHFEQVKKGDACNRYCGGSHTLTTPQQRVTRLGHFLEQWGPEISMVTDSEIKGKDGMIYRGEEKVEPKPQPTPDARTVERPSMNVHGKILSNRPGFEQPEKLSLRSQDANATKLSVDDNGNRGNPVRSDSK